MADDDFDAVGFLKALHDRLTTGKSKKTEEGTSSAPKATEKGTKRGREESGSEEKEDRNSAGRFVNENKAAKRSKDSSVTDAIKAINGIYSESSKMPEALKNQLAQQVCQSYGMNIDASVFSSKSGEGEPTEPASEEAKSEEKEGEDSEASSETKEGSEATPSEPTPQAYQQPTQAPIATTFDLSAFSNDEIMRSLSPASSAFADNQALASSIAGSIGNVNQ